ncbi:MAG: MmgE/PrpD family protein [Chloroflexi bacterium]|nr:MmgE/PrpD family protein [Chloroflexota bacterium]
MDTTATQAKVDAAVTLAKHAVNVKYEDIPGDAVEATKKDILDTLAVTIGGSMAQGSKEMVELVKDWGGKEESTILAYGGRVPAPGAAHLNAIMSYMLDYSDTYDVNGQHPATVIIPVCFAMAERRGGVSGKELLATIAMGIDLSCRLACTPKQTTDLWGDGWWNSQVFNYFAAAACAGKILGLDEGKMISAFGIAGEQAAGYDQNSREKSSSNLMQPAFAAPAGILAALMAEKGIGGPRDSLEGQAGFYKVYFRGSYYRDPLLADLGKRFLGADVSLKPYPSCRWTNQFIQATLALREKHALKPEDVAEITAFVGENTHWLVCEHLEVLRNPQMTIQAQLNLPWTVATAMVYGKVSIENFTPEALKDRAVLQMVQKVTPQIDKSLNRSGQEPGIVEIKTRDGKVFSKRVDPDALLGNPLNPLSWDFIIAKLEDCASYSVKPISKKNLAKATEMVRKLEELDDVSAVVRLLG